MFSTDGFLSRHIAYILTVLVVGGTTFVLWFGHNKSQALSEQILVKEAQEFADSVTQFRTFYSSHIVASAKQQGIEFSHDYQGSAKMPLPATLSMDFGKYLSNTDFNYQVRLYSDHPFPWRTASGEGGPRDSFERWALQELTRQPGKPVWRIEQQNGSSVMRFAKADRLSASCVGCHNSYPGTVKTDWKAGDVRGVLSVSRPMGTIAHETSSVMMQSFLMLGLLGAILLIVMMLSVRSMRVSLIKSQVAEKDARVANQKLVQGIEEREQLSRNLQASEVKVRAIVDSILDAIIVINSQGTVIETNPAVREVFGYESDELIGQNISTLMPDSVADHHDRYLRDYIAGKGFDVIGEVRQLKARRKDGVIFPIDLSVNESRVDDNIIFTGVIRDITHRIESEKALEQAHEKALQSTRMKSEFLANMSHEIRTPMNGVIGMSSLLLDSDLDPSQREQVNTVLHSAESLLRIINDILDVSKIEAGKLTINNSEFELLPLVERVMDLLGEQAYSKNIELAFFIEPGVPNHLFSDPVRIRQILINLINNAIKFTDQGYVILRISAEETDSDAEVMLCLEVLDSGSGIPVEAQETLFKAFTQVDGSSTRQHGGTGLGLTICKRLAHLMGGEIGLRSKYGKGSSFWTTLRVGVSEEGSDGWELANGISVLLLGNNLTLNGYYERQLMAWGMIPIVTNTLNHLLTALEENNSFSVIALDADMVYHKPEHPLGMLSVINAVRENTDALLIIYGSSRQLNALRGLKLGRRVSLLSKPLKHTVVQEALVRFTAAVGSSKMELPAPVKQIATENKAPRTGQPSSSNFQDAAILLVEDNLVNQRVAQAMLAKLGFQQVDSVENGEQALKAVQQKEYDLVLMDCQMPVMDGYDATRRIRKLEDERFQKLPVLALTAHTMKGDDEKCYAVGMNDYLSKPVRQDELSAKLDKWLKAGRKVAAVAE